MPTTYPAVDWEAFTLADFHDGDRPDIFDKAHRFNPFLADWRRQGTMPYDRVMTSVCSGTCRVRDPGGAPDRELIQLSSNNYLGLNTHADVVAAGREAIERFGSGMSGSRVLSGTCDLVKELERELAAFEGKEDAIVFTTGYQANVGTLSALLRPGDTVYIDKLAHASIVDGCRLSGATIRVFRHGDCRHLEQQLHQARGSGGKLVAVDGVFSMDGDLAPVPELLEVCRHHGARLLLDDAHGTGVVGPNGHGSAALYGVSEQVDMIVGTLSKSLAGTGGFVAADRDVVDYLRFYARAYTFTAAGTPSTVAMALAALRVVQREPEHHERLWRNIRHLHLGLRRAGLKPFPDMPASAVLTLTVGADATVCRIARAMLERGLFVSAIHYPAVPMKQGKLRLSVSALHTLSELDRAIEILAETFDDFGLDGASQSAGAPRA